MVIIRLGAAKVASHLPPLLEAIAASNHKDSIILLCDPMHGNTQTSPYPPASTDPNAQPLKTRSFGDIISEILSFLQIISSDFPALHLGGVHLELTATRTLPSALAVRCDWSPKTSSEGTRVTAIQDSILNSRSMSLSSSRTTSATSVSVTK